MRYRFSLFGDGPNFDPVKAFAKAFAAAAWLVLVVDVHSASATARDVKTHPSSAEVLASQFHVEPVKIIRSGTAVTLRMRVWNCGSKPWVTFTPWMPWGIHMTTLVLAQAGIADAVQTAAPMIGDPPYTDTTIPANGYVDGDIHLDWYFPHLGSEKDFNGLVLLWAYDLASLSRPDKMGPEAYAKSVVPIGGAFPLAGPWDTTVRNPCGKDHESKAAGGVR